MEAWRETACSTWNPDRAKLDQAGDESIARQWRAYKKRERKRARNDIANLRKP